MRGRDVADVSKALFTGHRQYFRRGEEADEGSAACASSLNRSLERRTKVDRCQLDGQHERHYEHRSQCKRRELTEGCGDGVPGQIHADAGRGDDGWLMNVET